MALMHSTIGVAQFSEIFLRLGIDSGSRSGLQNLINSSGECIQKLAEENMSEERAKIRRRGQPIDVSCDTRYNSAVGSGNTPFQAGTQAVFTVIEQETQEKKLFMLAVTVNFVPLAQN